MSERSVAELVKWSRSKQGQEEMKKLPEIVEMRKILRTLNIWNLPFLQLTTLWAALINVLLCHLGSGQNAFRTML